jgi:hypothetical protein
LKHAVRDDLDLGQSRAVGLRRVVHHLLAAVPHLSSRRSSLAGRRA